MSVLFVRNGRALVSGDGSVPSSAPNELLVISSYAVGEVTVVTAWTGSPPDGWSLRSIPDVQAANPELADAIGVALLDPRAAA